jgi:hypothetical protein
MKNENWEMTNGKSAFPAVLVAWLLRHPPPNAGFACVVD